METITDHDAARKFATVLETIDQGREVTITRDGVPVAKIVPIEPIHADFETQKREMERQAADGLRELGAKLSLNGLTIRELIDEGPR